MIRRTLLLMLVVGLALCGTACPPTDHAGNKPPAGEQVTVDQLPPPPTPLPVAKGPTETQTQLRDRVDAALQEIRSRDMSPDYSFWTVFHGILGVGPESAYLGNQQTGKRVKAVDYVCAGGILRGLEFVAVDADHADVVTMPGSGTFQGHQDQFIAEMAQWGMQPDKEFIVQGKKYQFESFIRQSRDRASVTAGQELSWAIIIIAQYYSTDYNWTNNRGEMLRFDDVVRYELEQPIKDCPVCGGTHRLFGLSWAYHLHIAKGGKKTDLWKAVEEKTHEYRELVRKLQNKDGSFSTSYLRGPGNNQTDLTLRIHSTGHVFEWLALALSDEELRQPWMENAAHALATMILNNRTQGLDGGAVYHAVHGLCIYRNRVFGPTPNPPVIPPPPK